MAAVMAWPLLQYVETSSGSCGEPWGIPEVKVTFNKLQLLTEQHFVLKMSKLHDVTHLK